VVLDQKGAIAHGRASTCGCGSARLIGGGESYDNATVDDVRIYGTALSAADIATMDDTWAESYAYNQIGNMTSKNGDAYTYNWHRPAPDGSLIPHAVSQVGGTSYEYDVAGNMTKRGSQDIGWDVENRVSSAGNETYVYDGDGKRAKKIVTGGNTTIYVNKYYEVNVTANPDVVTTSYYLGGKLIAQREGDTLRYVHQDSLSGTSVMSDGTTGESVGSIKYFPFGATRPGGSVPTDVKFTGQRLDATGLYYYGARYYDAEIGRFVSPDTIVPAVANPQTWNRYSYVVNNPLKYKDPTGHRLVFGDEDFGPCSGPCYLWPPGPERDLGKAAWNLVVDKGKAVTAAFASGMAQQGEAQTANIAGNAAAGQAVATAAVAVAQTAADNAEVGILAVRVAKQNPSGLLNDALGASLAALSGGDVSIDSHGVVVVENAGGFAKDFMDDTRAPAFDMGHVAFSAGPLPPGSGTAQHEIGGHTPQYELLGGAFLPLYGVAQLAAWGISSFAGGDPHDYNVFEVWADAWSDWWY